MSIQFPDAPAQGDSFVATNGVSYTYDNGGWIANSQSALDDRFVNLDGDTMTGDLTVPSLNGGPLAGFRNQIRNPFFAVWQRNSPLVVTNPGTVYSDTFGADGWTVRGNTGGTSTLSKGIPGGTIMSTYMSQVNSGHTDRFYLRQKLESVTTLAGQTVTLTVKLQSSVAFSLDPTLDQVFGQAASATPHLETSSIEGAQEVSAGSIQTLSWTYNLPSIEGKTIDKYVDSVVQVLIWSTAAVNGTIQWIGVQLEPGPVATPFEQRPIATELALCHRYYYKETGNIRILCARLDQNAGSGFGQYSFPQTMRAVPTFEAQGDWLSTQGYGGLPKFSVTNTVQAVLSTSVGNLAANKILFLNNVADSGTIAFDAEL